MNSLRGRYEAFYSMVQSLETLVDAQREQKRTSHDAFEGMIEKLERSIRDKDHEIEKYATRLAECNTLIALATHPHGAC